METQRKSRDHARIVDSPWYKTRLPLRTSEISLDLLVPHDVFSTQRIDEGTLLLLEALPEASPKVVLDLGCGYGALGLPLAKRFPDATFDLVDRDLLAVEWADRNARHNGLSNVRAQGSLGFRSTGSAYDWILCNVPARIGKPFIHHLIEGGRARLAPNGELRLVIILDLLPLLQELSHEGIGPWKEVKRGPRHAVVSFPPSGKPIPEEPKDLYLRDSVPFGSLAFDRPFDLGGDDPKRLSKGLPALLDVLPKQTVPKQILSFRSGYGIVPLISRSRWPDAFVHVIERDLLASDFIRRNAKRLSLEGPLLAITETSDFPDALRVSPSRRFDLVLGELSSSAGERVATAELEALTHALVPGGQALILALEKLYKDWIRTRPSREFTASPVISREGYVVLRLVRA